MTEPDPNETPTITVPPSATTGAGNGSTAMSIPPDRPRTPEPGRPAEERVVPPPPPSSTVLPRTSPPAMLTPPPGPPPEPTGRPPAPGRTAAAAGARWMIIHPHVSFFGWLADRQGPADAAPEERLDRYRRNSPWLFRICVVLDLIVLFVVTGILVGALAAVLFKAIFGVI